MLKSPSNRSFIHESGQALVLVLLSLSVVLTIVLFVLARSVTDISTSTKQSDSVRAFSAAEAGIERALIAGTAQSGDINGSNYSVTVSQYSGQTSFNYPIILMSGDTMTTWFVSHDSDGNIVCGAGNPCFAGDTLKFCWGNSGTSAGGSTTPAIEISIYWKVAPGNFSDFSDVRLARVLVDPNSARTVTNSFSGADAGTCAITGVSYAFQKTITLSSLGITSNGSAGGLLFAKVRSIYNTDSGHIIGVSANFAGNSTLPSQGLDITSTGTSGAEGSESNRRVSVFKGWPEFPFSGFSISAPVGITK